ncbi:MAG: hypothetical protein EPN97_01455 [Alphaproteobacteria bacterium]|nr:MAG: hypothetical protein EPN97_01455 [Alphaproteobacteria bacterium]
MISYHEFFGLASFGISLWGSTVYIASIFKGQTKPHVYTHLVWGIVTAIAFFAQVFDKAGPGAWATGLTAATCLLQSGLALKYGEKSITLTDKIALLTAGVAIIAWVVTKDSLLSVILSSLINLAAFYPTCRKSWLKPWEENLTAYNIANIKILLSIMAITHVTLVTTIYPVACIVVNMLFVALCMWRRQALNSSVAA